MAGKRKLEKISDRKRTVGRIPFKRFIIYPEGTLTEPRYIRILDSLIQSQFPDSKIRIAPRLSNHSGPKHILTKIKNDKKNGHILASDDVWAWIDRDKWQISDIEHLKSWKDQGEVEHFDVGVSDPKFELWLLYHFEKGNGQRTPEEIDRKLKGYIQDYQKDIPKDLIDWKSVKRAIENAKSKDKDYKGNVNYPHSEIYRMLERMISIAEKRSLLC